jgi:hypothetical protein
MDTIIDYRTWALAGSEVVTFATTTDRQIQESGGAAALGIDALYPLYAELTLNLQQIYQATANNPLTAAKEKAEQQRDHRYGAFVAFVRNALYDSRPEVNEAAESIMEVLKNAGNPVKLSDSKETAELYSLVARLEPLAPQIALIGADVRLQELKDANREFELQQDEWYKAGAQKLTGSLSAIRKQWAPVYKSIIYRINAMMEVNGATSYQTFAAAHNETITHYRNLIAQRRGRNKAEKANTATKVG